MLELSKNPETLQNEVTEHKKSDMEGLNSKNKNFKDSGSP